MTRRPLRESLRDPSTVRLMWAAAGVCFVLLVGAVIFQEARRTNGCTGPARAEADAFTRALVTAGRDAAFTHLATYARPLVGSIPDLPHARPAEVRELLAGGRRNAHACVYFRASPLPAGEQAGPCFGYDLPPRLAAADPTHTAFALTVACENGAWRVNGFL